MGIITGLLKFLGFLVLAFFVVWGSLALWYRLPAAETLRLIAAAAVGLLGLYALLRYWTRTPWKGLIPFGVVLALIGAWWQTIDPPRDADWSADVARQLSGEIKDNILTLHNIRDFTWRSTDDFDENWIDKSYDLTQLQSTDMVLSHWGSPAMAHFIVSFGFANGEYLAWSIEVRRMQGGGFSPVEDFFKTHTIAHIASLETDVIGTRSNVRGEDVYIYRLDMEPAETRLLLELYLKNANRQIDDPQWFNSLFSNCSSTVLNLLKANGLRIPADYRLVANGYIDEFAYDKGLLAKQVPFAELQRDAHINERAKAHGLTEGFSQAIRKGIPLPQS